ncbi:MAG TPA: hypothetical protein VFJ58_06050 [Armatimonadota bacterium]|nr:hypothetical protein [Armatimonadota bacterium]
MTIPEPAAGISIAEQQIPVEKATASVISLPGRRSLRASLAVLFILLAAPSFAGPAAAPAPPAAPAMTPAEQAAAQAAHLAAVEENRNRRLIHGAVPGGLTRVDPNAGPYPASSLADFSDLLKPPAGRFGYLSAGPDGHFHWSNGQRARFWGVSISRRSIMLPHPEIARVANTLARSGCNLVRFEALDGHGPHDDQGILDGSDTDSRHINQPFMNSLQFWIACLRARGIYYYLDLLDFRHFMPGDGVANADKLPTAARPYAIFDPTLIELQQEYARQILLTMNPYTRLRPVDDPALVMVELINEHGLFSSITDINKLAPPYNIELQRLWDQWLLAHYGNREALAAHWAAASVPLSASENPATGTVPLAAMPPSEAGWDQGGVRSARVRDQVDFLADTQRDYFRTMRDFLHGIGVRCPITASVTSVVGPDVLSVAQELDCTTGNFYADHPKFAGAEWTGPSFYNNDNQLRSSQPTAVAPQIAVLRWNNKPVVIREWDTAWPNQFRATSVPDMATYASLQDVDMVLAFTYVTGADTNRLLDFSIQSDPTFWGLFGAGARIFLGGLIEPARYDVDLAYSAYDLQHWGPFFSQLHRLAWVSRVRNVVNGALAPPARGLTVFCGRGGWASLPRQNSLLFQRLDAVPPPDREASVDNLLSSNKIPLTTSPLATQLFRFDGLIYDKGSTRPVETTIGFLLGGLKSAGYTPVGVDTLGQVAFGAYDPSTHQLVLPTVTAEQGLRASLDLLGQLGANSAHDEVDVNHWHSDTGQIIRNSDVGRLEVAAPSCAMLAGEFPVDALIRTGALSVKTHNPDGAIVAVSLDSHPLDSSRQWLIKMVTHAENTGQDLEPAVVSAPADYMLQKEGGAPIITGGVPSAAPTVVSLGGRLAITIFATGGTWELLRNGGRVDFACDTPGIHFRIGGARAVFVVTPQGKRIPVHVDRVGLFTYPTNALAIEATL